MERWTPKTGQVFKMESASPKRTGIEDRSASQTLTLAMYETQPSSVHAPAGVVRPLRWLAAVACMGWLLSVGLLWWQHLARVLHPNFVLFVCLVAVTLCSSLATLFLGLWRFARGPDRRRAIGWTAVGILPLVGWGALTGYALRCSERRYVPHNPPMILMARLGHNLMEGQAVCFYPHRMESKRVVMFYDDQVSDPKKDLEAMDEHVARLEALLELPLRSKIYWVRGPLLGRSGLCCNGIALGSNQSPTDYLDRHELAHAVIYQQYGPDTDPPTMLGEGWAESQSVEANLLADRAFSLREILEACRKLPEVEGREELHAMELVEAELFESLLQKARAQGASPSYIRELTSASWYHLGSGPVYSVGGAFSAYVIRRLGAKAYRDFYLACRPGTFEVECQEVFGVSLDELERDFWEDAEHQSQMAASDEP